MLKIHWFLNLSFLTIPKDIQCFLQFGENFSLPSKNLEKIVVEVRNIKNVENTNKIPIDTQLTIRNRFIPIFNDFSFSVILQ